MRIDEQQHPDYEHNKRVFYATRTGGNEAAEDAAIFAYFAALAVGRTEDEAAAAFFDTYKNATRRI